MSVEMEFDAEDAFKYLNIKEEEFIALGYEILRRLGLEIVKCAKDKYVPVKTGRLRESIRMEDEGLEGVRVVAGGIVVWGVMVDYAVYQEFGTRYVRPTYFMHNALVDAMGRFREIAEESKRVGRWL